MISMIMMMTITMIAIIVDFMFNNLYALIHSEIANLNLKLKTAKVPTAFC